MLQRNSTSLTNISWKSLPDHSYNSWMRINPLGWIDDLIAWWLTARVRRHAKRARELTRHIRSADVHFGTKCVLILPVHHPPYGLAVGGLSAIKLSADPRPTELGEAVLAAFRDNRDIPDFTDEEHRQNLRKIAKTAGYSKYYQFTRSTTFCSVYAEHETVSIHPTHRDGKGGYFGTKEDLPVTCRLDADEIGKTLLQVRPMLT